MDHARTQKQLQFAAIFYGAFGLVTAAAALPALSLPTLLITDIILWPIDGAQSLASPETRTLCAILGGVLVGWAVMIWLTATKLYPRDPALARSIILTSVTTWFVIDSAASVLAGAPVNIIPNLAFAALVWLPLRQQPETSRA